VKGRLPQGENRVSRRIALIALNANLDLPRAAICNLARELDGWINLDAGGDLSVPAQSLGARPDHLRAALETRNRAPRVAESELSLASEHGARIITLLDGEYPPDLRQLELPPPVLYCRGEIPHQPMVAIVGSRHADSYAVETATLFGRHLSGSGLAVISGFARGVDAAAHRGALASPGGCTIAVLGCGLDVDYPRGHSRLGGEISERGALVSELPWGAAPLAQNFPVRNRIIAALAVGTLVVQGAARSGSLITARLALGLGREVYAVPGRIFDRRAVGPNTLIRDGALLAQHPRDILESLPLAVQQELPLDHPAAPADPAPPLGGAPGRILGLLVPGDPQPPEAIARRLKLPIEEVMGLLLELELVGWVRRHPGPLFGRSG